MYNLIWIKIFIILKIILDKLYLLFIEVGINHIYNFLFWKVYTYLPYFTMIEKVCVALNKKRRKMNAYRKGKLVYVSKNKRVWIGIEMNQVNPWFNLKIGSINWIHESNKLTLKLKRLTHLLNELNLIYD